LDARWWSRGTGRGRPVQVAGGSFEVRWVVLMRDRIAVPGPRGHGRWSLAGDTWHRGSPGWAVEGIRGGLRQIRERVGPESMKKTEKKKKTRCTNLVSSAFTFVFALASSLAWAADVFLWKRLLRVIKGRMGGLTCSWALSFPYRWLYRHHRPARPSLSSCH
jgi:hypothetical protein